MKRTLTAITAAVMLLTAVSCGEKKTDSPLTEDTAAATEAAAESSSENTTEEETVDYGDSEFKEKIRERTKDQIEDCIGFTELPVPDFDNIPDDWQEISYNNISLRVPQDIMEVNSDDVYFQKAYADESGDRAVRFLGGLTYDEGFISNMYFPEITADVVKKTFEILGVEYDGTIGSSLRALLAVTEDTRTDSNASAFEIASILKADAFGSYKEVRYKNVNGYDVFFKKGSYSEDEDGFVYFIIDIYDRNNVEYLLSISGKSLEEALMMCSTLKIEK